VVKCLPRSGIACGGRFFAAYGMSKNSSGFSFITWASVPREQKAKFWSVSLALTAPCLAGDQSSNGEKSTTHCPPNPNESREQYQSSQPAVYSEHSSACIPDSRVVEIDRRRNHLFHQRLDRNPASSPPAHPTKCRSGLVELISSLPLVASSPKSSDGRTLDTSPTGVE